VTREAIDVIARETGFSGEEAREILVGLGDLRQGSEARLVSLINVLLLRYDHVPAPVER
jgi:hypothetical protein